MLFLEDMLLASHRVGPNHEKVERVNGTCFVLSPLPHHFLSLSVPLGCCLENFSHMVTDHAYHH
jgi:hypothetical protein